GDVFTGGVLIQPADFAPEANPAPDGTIPPAKIALGITRKVLFQGDGTVPDAVTGLADPVPMLRMAMQTAPGSPAAALAAQLAQVKVLARAENTLNPNHISEIGFYYDPTNTGV